MPTALPWVEPEAKKSSSLTGWSKLGGTLPARSSFFWRRVVCVGDGGKLREKGNQPQRHAKANDFARRGSFLAWALLFRVQNLRWAIRVAVDGSVAPSTFNILGLSMMLMGVLCWPRRWRRPRRREFALWRRESCAVNWWRWPRLPSGHVSAEVPAVAH